MYFQFSPRTVDFSCPVQGSSWHVCYEKDSSHFVGCCRTDPCAKGCPDGALEPASFPAEEHDKLGDQFCQVGQWYTCTGTHPPFVGCCVSDPCKAKGCPKKDLRAGQLSQNAAQAAAFLPAGVSIVPVAGPSVTKASDPSATKASNPANGKANGSKLRIIAGSVVGAVSFLLLVVCAIIYFIRRNRKRAYAYSRAHTAHTIPNQRDNDVIPSMPLKHMSTTTSESYTSPPPALIVSSTSQTPRFSNGQLTGTMVGSEGDETESRPAATPHMSQYSSCSPYVSGLGIGEVNSAGWPSPQQSPLPDCLHVGPGMQSRTEDRAVELEAEVPGRNQGERPMPELGRQRMW